MHDRTERDNTAVRDMLWRRECRLAFPFFLGWVCVIASIVIAWTQYYGAASFGVAGGTMLTGAGLITWGYRRAQAWRPGLKAVLIVLSTGMGCGFLFLFYLITILLRYRFSFW